MRFWRSGSNRLCSVLRFPGLVRDFQARAPLLLASSSKYRVLSAMPIDTALQQRLRDLQQLQDKGLINASSYDAAVARELEGLGGMASSAQYAPTLRSRHAPPPPPRVRSHGSAEDYRLGPMTTGSAEDYRLDPIYALRDGERAPPPPPPPSRHAHGLEASFNDDGRYRSAVAREGFGGGGAPAARSYGDIAAAAVLHSRLQPELRAQAQRTVQYQDEAEEERRHEAMLVRACSCLLAPLLVLLVLLTLLVLSLLLLLSPPFSRRAWSTSSCRGGRCGRSWARCRTGRRCSRCCSSSGCCCCCCCWCCCWWCCSCCWWCSCCC